MVAVPVRPAGGTAAVPVDRGIRIPDGAFGTEEGAAMQRGGLAIATFAGQQARAEDRQQARDDANFVANTITELHANQTQAFLDAKNGAGEGAPDFTLKFLGNYDSTVAAMADNAAKNGYGGFKVSENGINAFRTKANELKTAFTNQAALFQDEAHRGKMLADGGKSLEYLQRAVMNDPNGLDVARKQLDDVIGAQSTFQHPDTITKLKDEWPQVLAASAVEGLIQQNRYGEAEALLKRSDIPFKPSTVASYSEKIKAARERYAGQQLETASQEAAGRAYASPDTLDAELTAIRKRIETSPLAPDAKLAATRGAGAAIVESAVKGFIAKDRYDDAQAVLNRAATGGRETNLQAATRDMKLSPQEQFLYQQHLKNLAAGGVKNADGSTSTLLQMGVEADGKQYNVPTVWDNKVVPPDEAMRRAREVGLEKFPAYDSQQEAETRYQKMHQYMERDLPGAKGAGGSAGPGYGMPPAQIAALSNTIKHERMTAESADVTQLMQADIASRRSTGVPVAALTEDRVARAHGGGPRGDQAVKEYRMQAALADQEFATKVQLQTATPAQAAEYLDAIKPKEGDPRYDDKQQAFGRAAVTWQTIQKARADDPAGYAVQASRKVSAAWEAADTAQDPAARLALTQQAIATGVASQRAMGIPESNIGYIPVGRLKAIVGRVTEGNADQAVAAIDALRASAGEQFWPQVRRELGWAKLPDAFLVVADMPPGRPARLLATAAKTDDKTLKDPFEPEERKSVEEGVRAALKDWAGTLGHVEDAPQILKRTADAAEKLAFRYMLTGDEKTGARMSASEAVRTAVADVATGGMSLVQGGGWNVRVPANLERAVTDTGARMLMNMQPADLPDPGGAPNTTPEWRKGQAHAAALNGRWVMSDKGDGVVRLNNAGQIVRREDGSEVGFRFADAHEATPRERLAFSAGERERRQQAAAERQAQAGKIDWQKVRDALLPGDREEIMRLWKRGMEADAKNADERWAALGRKINDLSYFRQMFGAMPDNPGALTDDDRALFVDLGQRLAGGRKSPIKK